MDIYRNNIIKASIHPTDDSAYSSKLMGDNIVRLNFKVATAIDLSIGDYILWRGQTFALNTQPVIREVATREVEYNCEFQAIDYDLLKTGYKLFDNNSIPLSGEFSLSGKAATFVQLIVDNLNRNGSGWTVGSVIESELKTLTFSGENCSVVLARLASEFSTEYYIGTDKSVNLYKKGFAGSVISLSYGMGNGLKWLRRINRDTDPVVTCLYAYGASTNLPYGYRNGATRLMLPGTNYILQNVSLYGVREGDKIWEDVYPRLSAGSSTDPGTVTGVTGFLQFTDAYLDFDVNDTLTAETAKVRFNTGELTGYEFDVSLFTAATNTYTLIAAEYDGLTLPSASICAAAGDQYVLVNINMPAAYVERAELELADKALEYLGEVSKIRDSFNAECDILYFQDNNIVLTIGQVVRIESTTLNVDREIRVIGFVQNLNFPFKYDVEFGEKAVTGTIEKLSTELANNTSIIKTTQVLNWQTTLQLLQQINGASTPTDFSTITGLPTDSAALNQYLNAFADAKSEINSGAIPWEYGLKYQATDIVYKILGIPYRSQAREITLADADPLLSRIDTFYVDMFGNLNVATGIAAINPTSTLLNTTQLEVMTVLIGAGATEPSDLGVVTVYDENAVQEWTHTNTTDGYVSIDFSATDVTRSGDNRIAITIDVPDTVIESPYHYVGEKYGGGIIIKLDTDGKSGLIVAENDTATDEFWSRLSGYSGYSTGATGVEIGTGQANTALILANAAANRLAVKYCDELVVGDYDDWYFPSEKELDLIYFNRFKIGNLGNKTYWSSTEVAWNKSRCISFANGGAYTRDKNNRYCVRAIRLFDDDTLIANQPVETLTTVNTKLTFSTAGPVPTTAGLLSFFVKSTVTWRLNSMLCIESYLGATRTGSVVISPSGNKYNYKPDDDSWQLTAVAMSSFNSSRSTVDGFRFSLVGSWPNKIDLGFDVIRYQYSKIDIKNGSVYQIGVRLSPLPDSVNTNFDTPKTYKPGSTTVYANGVKQMINIDYTETGGKIVFLVTPETGEILTCDYYTL